MLIYWKPACVRSHRLCLKVVCRVGLHCGAASGSLAQVRADAATPLDACSGLVAAEEAAQPFEHCDVVSTTTHKSLRGPRAGMIFFRRVGRAIW